MSDDMLLGVIIGLVFGFYLGLPAGRAAGIRWARKRLDEEFPEIDTIEKGE
ncbi:hypothetical protein FF098_014600 [Parvularcula flava]|uniref:Uncharacterized protein n=1 Tax=Aquisalinus luteolus TaxID=1566827 RepID=A0A8J3A9Z3_9PROT|nr:hypothetical protein [Aquisalinus luteolus]NHK29147.1 hypothetical protein [Aquisalinus luteolus]GGI00164.1 hypothetical protein GCM10011355_27810 [Aquisalinus luteolus]